MNDFNEIMKDIESVMRSCARIMLGANRTQEMITSKEGHANFVTTYDKKVQEELRRELRKILPQAAFAGEEDGEFFIPETGITFVVDPIDGTTNFIYDYHVSCISVGIIKDGQRYAGLVYNPYLDEMYTAVKGCGAYLNGEKIRVYEGDAQKGLSLFGTSPYNLEFGKKSFELAYKLFRHSADIRRSGSAAIDMCNVAAGRVTVYFEMILSPWDFAAASLILEEAGGKVTDMEGKELEVNKKCSVIARGKNMEAVVKDVFFDE